MGGSLDVDERRMTSHLMEKGASHSAGVGSVGDGMGPCKGAVV